MAVFHHFYSERLLGWLVICLCWLASPVLCRPAKASGDLRDSIAAHELLVRAALVVSLPYWFLI